MATKHGGAKLGTRISMLVSQATISTHQKLIGVKHKLAMAIFHSISDMISGEVHQTMDPIFSALFEAYPKDGMASKSLDFMAHATGQLQAIAGTNLIAGGLLSSISQVVNNELAPAVYGLIASNPHGVPDPNTIAQLIAHGIADPSAGNYAINANGLGTGWANDMVEGNVVYPDPATALDLVRRGVISEGDYLFFAKRNGINANSANMLFQLVTVPLSPADAALALLRGNMSQGDAQDAAAQSGVSASDFEVMVNNTGEPLGLEQLLEAYRRGFITKARLEEGILQSRVRNEWIGTAEQLRYVPMSTADAVNAVVQNQLSESEAAAIADQNGLEPGSFPTLVATAGEPLSRTELEFLYNRGQITLAQVKQGLNESRLKPKYTDMAVMLSQKNLPVRNLSDAVLYGTLTQAEAVVKAMEEGYSEENATVLVSSASMAKLQEQRKAVVTAVEQLYENNAISQDDAIAIAGQMGFEAPEATFIFEAAEFRRQEKLISAAISVVRSKYIGHHIDENTASSSLDAIGVVPAQRDAMLQLWTIEHDANVKVLTEAQIVKAAKLTLITQEDAAARLQGMGYSADDAALLLAGA